jgi:quaternary ammonium compound-resistance protein SugE
LDADVHRTAACTSAAFSNREGESVAWLYLVVAGLLEVGWPLGLKLGWTDQGVRTWPIVGSVICMIFSGALLLIAQRTIPMGTAYAVWTGLGAVGTFLVGVALFRESGHPVRFFFLGLIITGIIGLKFSSKH